MGHTRAGQVSVQKQKRTRFEQKASGSRSSKSTYPSPPCQRTRVRIREGEWTFCSRQTSYQVLDFEPNSLSCLLNAGSSLSWVVSFAKYFCTAAERDSFLPETFKTRQSQPGGDLSTASMEVEQLPIGANAAAAVTMAAWQLSWQQQD